MASRRLFDGAQIEIGSLPIVGAATGAYTLFAEGVVYSYSGNDATLTHTPSGNYSLAADGGVYTYSGNDNNLRYSRVLVASGGTYNYLGNDATLTYSGGPPPVVEVIGVCGPQVTNVFLFNGVVEPPFPVQRRTS